MNWIKIINELSLPNSSCYCWIICDNKKYLAKFFHTPFSNPVFELVGNRSGFDLLDWNIVSHYVQITEPEWQFNQ